MDLKIRLTSEFRSLLLATVFLSEKIGTKHFHHILAEAGRKHVKSITDFLFSSQTAAYLLTAFYLSTAAYRGEMHYTKEIY